MLCCGLSPVLDGSSRSCEGGPRAANAAAAVRSAGAQEAMSEAAITLGPAMTSGPAVTPGPATPVLAALASPTVAPPAVAAPVAPQGAVSGAAPVQSDSITVRGIKVTLADVARVAPLVTFHPRERHFPCAIEALLAGACLKGAGGEVLVQNPRGADLAAHAGAGNRLWLDGIHVPGGDAPAGGRITAPMYVVVQVPEDRSYVDIRYVLLFAYQGAQVVLVLVPGKDFDTFLPHFGEHQGDIESVRVRLTPDLQSITAVTFEEHGKPQTFAASEVLFDHGHLVARCALESHAMYNAHNLAGDTRVEHTEETRKPIPGFGVAFVDLVSENGARWAPYETYRDGGTPFIWVGLDQAGKPVNDQPWAAYAGIIGGAWRNDFAGAQGIAKPLSFMQRTYVNGLAKAVVAAGKLPEHRRVSNGTAGLGGRDWIRLEP